MTMKTTSTSPDLGGDNDIHHYLLSRRISGPKPPQPSQMQIKLM